MFLPCTWRDSKSSLKTSRTTRTASSGSPLRSTGADLADFDFCWISAHFLGKALDVLAELIFRGSFGRRTDYHSVLGGNDFLEELLEPLTFPLGELAGNPRHGSGGNENKMATSESDLGREARTLVSDRILSHLNKNGLA